MTCARVVVFVSLVNLAAGWAEKPKLNLAVRELPSDGKTTEEQPLPAPEYKHESWPIPTSDERVLYGLGAYGYMLIVPGWLLDPFLKAHTELLSGGAGLQFFRRKGTFNVALSLDFGWYNAPDGNY